MKNLKITLLQSFTLIISIVVGTGILTLPATLAKLVKQDAWISVILGGGVVILVLNLGFLLIKSHPGKNILDISINLLGPFLGKTINLLLFLEFYFFALIVLRNFVDFVSTWILQKTPIEVLMMFIMVTTLYLTYCGLSTVVKFAEITTLILIPFFLIIFLPYENWDILNIFPIASQTLAVYASASLKTAFALLGFEVIFLVIPLVQGSMKKIFYTTNLAVILIILTYCATVVVTILAFGATDLQREIYASLNYTGFITIALLERFEFAMMYFWTFAMFSTFALYFHFSITILRSIFPFQVNNRWIPLLLMATLRPLALIPQNVPAVGQTATIIGIFGFSVVCGAILLLNIVTLIKRKQRY